MAIPRPPKTTQRNPFCGRSMERGKMPIPKYCNTAQGRARENPSTISNLLTENSKPKWFQPFSTRFLWFVLFRWGVGLVSCCFFASIALDKNHDPFSCWILPALPAAFPGRFIFCGKQRLGGGRRELQPSPAAPSHILGKAQAPCRARPRSGRSFSIFPGKENAIPCPGRLLRARFCIQITGHGAGRSPQTTRKSVTVCSSAGGKHCEYQLQPGSFPGVISL